MSTSQPPRGHWRPWGDHPLVVALVLIGVIVTLITAWPALQQAIFPDNTVVYYLGRVVDSRSQEPVDNAEVSFDTSIAAPLVVYTDSKGIFRFSLQVHQLPISGKIRVESPNYKIFTQNISLSSNALDLGEYRLEPGNESPPIQPTVQGGPSATPITIINNPISSFQTAQKALEYIRENGIDIAVRNKVAPYGYESNGKLVGSDLDLISELAIRWGIPTEKIREIIIDPKERISILADGQTDMTVAALSFTSDRCGGPIAECTDPYTEDGGRALVSRENTSIQSFCELDGKTVSVLEGTIMAEFEPVITSTEVIVPLTLNVSCDQKTAITIYRKMFSNRENAIDAIVKEATKPDDIVAHVTDGRILEAYRDGHPGLWSIIGEPVYFETKHIAIPRGAEGLKQLINLTLQAIYQDKWSEYYHLKWFSKETSICSPAPFRFDTTTIPDPNLSLTRDVMPPLTCDIPPTAVTSTTPAQSTQTPIATQVPSTTPASSQGIKTRIHIVSPGDTLGNIASRYIGNSQNWLCIKELNSSIVDPNLIYPKQSLIVPINYDECAKVITR